MTEESRTNMSRNRGFWIGVPPAEPQPAGDSPAGGPTSTAPPADAAAAGAPVVEASASRGRAAAGGTRVERKRRIRKRRLIFLGVVGVVVVAVVLVAVLVGTGRTVVPAISDKIFPIRYSEDIGRVAEQYGLDPYLVAAVVKAESGYNPEAVSPVGAVGLMQLMPTTAQWITELPIWQGGGDPELTDPADNLELGACYLAYLGESFGEENRQMVLAAYNAGPRNVNEWIVAAGGQDQFDLNDIQFTETRDFVKRVEGYRDLYKRIYPDAFAAAPDAPAAVVDATAPSAPASAGGVAAAYRRA